MSGGAQRIGIVGAGLQGRGLAQRFARAGLDVVIHDLSAPALAAARQAVRPAEARARVSPATRLDDLAGCALVIEAVPEDLALKRRVLGQIELLAPGAVLGSNSSSFTPEELAGALARPGRFLNLHFLGPETGNPLAELIRGPATDEGSAARAAELLRAAGFKPVPVGSCRAFVYNRLGNAGVGNLGRAVDLGLIELVHFRRYHIVMRPRPRPAAVLDHIGLDVLLSVLRACREAYGPRFGVPRWLERLVGLGHLGVKSGRGIVDHAAGAAADGLDEPVLPAARRPRTEIRAVAVRRPSLLVSNLLSALLGRPDRRLIFAAAEAAGFLERAARRAPSLHAQLQGRFQVVERPERHPADLLLDCGWGEPAAAKARALASWRGAAATPLLVCAPHLSAAALEAALGWPAELGLMFCVRGQALDAELVERGGASGALFRDLLLEALGRVIEIPDGAVRPLALLTVPRLLEARRIVAEGVASPAQIAELWGEDPLRDAEEWPAAVLGPVSGALESALGVSFSDHGESTKGEAA